MKNVFRPAISKGSDHQSTLNAIRSNVKTKCGEHVRNSFVTVNLANGKIGFVGQDGRLTRDVGEGALELAMANRVGRDPRARGARQSRTVADSRRASTQQEGPCRAQRKRARQVA